MADSDDGWAGWKWEIKRAIALIFAVTLAITGYVGWATWRRAPMAEENLPVITSLIFAQNGLVVPFEILSVLLLAALIAGVVIAFRDPEVE